MTKAPRKKTAKIFEEYQGQEKASPLATQLPWTHKAVLCKRLHEFYAQLVPQEDVELCHEARAEVLQQAAAAAKRRKPARKPGGWRG